jgi:hypothetical protein
MELFVILLCAALLLLWGIGSAVYIYLRENVINAGGKGAEKRMGRILSRYAAIRRFRVLRNLRFEAKEGAVPVEQLMVGFFGVLLVHTVGARGEFYGKLDDKEWVLVRDYKRIPFPNPYQGNQKAIAAIRALFSKNKLHNVPVHQVVVFTNASKKTSVMIAPDEAVLPRGKLKKYLQRTKFDHDAEIDVDRVAALLEPYSQKK